jgi:hypothetical protein
MGAHDEIGVEILNSAFSSPELTAIVANHHAWFAGRPDEPRLPAGEAIPLGARILAIADAFDAMVSDRVYRKGRTQGDAIAELRRCAGQQFDPHLVERLADQLDNRSKDNLKLPPPTPAALLLGQHMERLTAALEEKNYEKLAQMAGQLALTAQAEGPTRLATLASQLEQSALHQPDMHDLVALTTELLRLCETQQTSCLKDLQTSSAGTTAQSAASAQSPG